MLLKPERARLRNLISEAVLLLCKNSCAKEFQNLSIEGIIGITFDDEEVVLVSFKDEASISKVDKSTAIQKSPTVAPSDHNAEKATPHLMQEITVAPTSCEQIVSVANSQPSVRPVASKRKRTQSIGDENEKFCPADNMAGNDPLPDSSIHSSSGYKKSPSNSDILAKDDRPEIKILSSCTLADADPITRSSGSEFSSEPKLQHTLEKADNEISKTRRNSAGNSRLISVKNETTSFSELDSDVSVKCEERSEDGDCVFIKSEMFDLGDNSAFEFACDDAVMSNSRTVNEESSFGDNLLQYSWSDDFGVGGQSHGSGNNNQPFSRHRANSQHPEYIQRGCDMQAASSSSSGHTAQAAEDPTTFPLGSYGGDGPVECHICGAVLKCRWNLNDHIQGMHLSRYRYKCLCCGRGFKWRSTLGYHKRACKAATQSGFQR